jgi:hypothetical protein
MKNNNCSYTKYSLGSPPGAGNTGRSLAKSTADKNNGNYRNGITDSKLNNHLRLISLTGLMISVRIFLYQKRGGIGKNYAASNKQYQTNLDYSNIPAVAESDPTIR